MAGIQATPLQALGLSQPCASSATELDDDWYLPSHYCTPPFCSPLPSGFFGGFGTTALQKKQRILGKKGSKGVWERMGQ